MTKRRNELHERGGETFAEAMERALQRICTGGGYLIRGAAMAGVISAGMPALGAGCAADVGDNGTTTTTDTLLNSGVLDWAQIRGQRNTDMVSFDGTTWSQNVDCNTRMGCQTIEVFVKLLVRPVDQVNVADKHVGVIYRTPASTEPLTVTGDFVRTLDDGREEWVVPVRIRTSSPTLFTFDAWYEDGTWFWNEGTHQWGKRTYFDDNGGDLYPVVFGSNNAITRDWGETSIEVGPDGVHGSLVMRVANFDYDKSIGLVWTTDNWNTVHASGMGDAGTPNAFYFVEPYDHGGAPPFDWEKWRMDLAIDGPADHFEYAIVYRHGFAPGARTYEYWDNNGGSNYRVDAPTQPAEPGPAEPEPAEPEPVEPIPAEPAPY